MKQILISEMAKSISSETIAGNLMSDSIESVQLFPNGVVTDIYPANGNEAGKIDLIHDKDRGKFPVTQETTIQSLRRAPSN